MKTQLQAHIEAVNEYNSLVNKYAPLFAQAIAPFVGKKVIKADGGLMEKVKSVLPKITESVQNWHDRSSYSLRWGIRTCVSSNTSSRYHDDTFCFGEIQDGILLKVYNSEPITKIHTEKEVLQAQSDLQFAEQLLSKAKNALCPFKPFYY